MEILGSEGKSLSRTQTKINRFSLEWYRVRTDFAFIAVHNDYLSLTPRDSTASAFPMSWLPTKYNVIKL